MWTSGEGCAGDFGVFDALKRLKQIGNAAAHWENDVVCDNFVKL